MDPFTLALIIGGGASLFGSFLSNRTANKAADAQNKRTAMTDTQIQQFMSSIGGTGQRADPNGFFGAGNPTLDQLGMQQYKSMGNQPNPADFMKGFQLPGMPEIPNVYRDLGLATDPILQSMRSGPNDSALSSNLLDILGGNSSFDTSIISSALDPIRRRNLGRQAAALHASAPGLGSRFGSAIRRSEVDLRRQHLQDTTAIDAQMAFQAHEAAQARRLQAANELLGLGQLQLGRDTGALSGLLGQAGIGIQQGGLNLQQGQFGLDRSRLSLDAFMGTGQLGLAQGGQQAQLLQMLMGNQNAQNQQRLQALGLMSGQQVASGPGYGPSFGDMGQLALMFAMMNRGSGTPATT